MRRTPDFIIIGAMKSATSTLYRQLQCQPGICLTTPKEPNFFSDDDQYQRGPEWYESLFEPASPNDLLGEASTHYTKLPTHPKTLERMLQHVPAAKLIYVMRHPLDRLVSHYLHCSRLKEIRSRLNRAVTTFPELVDYGRYATQLSPFLDTYGASNVLLVFFDRLRCRPQEELERVCRFIGYGGTPRWNEELGPQNVSSDMMRKSPLRDAIVYAPVISQIRKNFVPQGVRDMVKRLWQTREPPRLTESNRRRLERVFDEDLAVLGSWLGVPLSCETFKSATSGPTPLEWDLVAN